jgi:hypothetical protein
VVGNRTDGQTITPRADVLWKGTSQFTQEEISLPEPSGGWGSNPRATDVVAANVRQPPVSGRLDLAITFRPDNWLVRALNTGSTPTWDAEDGDIARPALSLAAGRFRPGSLIDLVISKGNEFGVPNRCFALHNQGSTEFRYQLDTNTVYRVEPGTDPFGLATGLLNVADSYVDFVAACQHGGPDNWGHGGVMVFRGYNDGTFNTTPHWFFVDDHINRSGVHPKPCFVKVGDMNNDGLQDIVTSNNTSHTISVLLQIPYDDEQ